MSWPIPVGHHIVPVPLRPRLSFRVEIKRGSRRSHKNRYLVIFPKRITIIRLRTLPTTHIKVAAIGQVPRIETLLLPVTPPTDTRLTQVIKCRPHKVTNDVRVIDDAHPTVEC